MPELVSALPANPRTVSFDQGLAAVVEDLPKEKIETTILLTKYTDESGLDAINIHFFGKKSSPAEIGWLLQRALHIMVSGDVDEE